MSISIKEAVQHILRIENITNRRPLYQPISAYDYLKWRLAQSYLDDKYQVNEKVGIEGEKMFMGADVIGPFLFAVAIEK